MPFLLFVCTLIGYIPCLHMSQACTLLHSLPNINLSLKFTWGISLVNLLNRIVGSPIAYTKTLCRSQPFIFIQLCRLSFLRFLFFQHTHNVFFFNHYHYQTLAENPNMYYSQPKSITDFFAYIKALWKLSRGAKDNHWDYSSVFFFTTERIARNQSDHSSKFSIAFT